jgi:polar amino acid transport system ATP-binding protein
MIALNHVSKWFGSLHVLQDIDLSVAGGEVIVVCGPSGSGKSTLLRCINRLEEIDDGEIFVDGIDVNGPRIGLNRLRADIGVVFQSLNLYPHMTALRNITLAPMVVRGLQRQEAEEFGRELLAKVGIPEKAEAYPSQLSGGQQQRVAIARALVNKPRIVLADEPTGNLDSENSLAVLDALKSLNAQLGQTVLMITHNPEAAEYCARRVVRMKDGRIA